MLNQINADITEILQNSRYIAVVGASPNVSRPSNQIARYLQNANYRVLPVNPKYTRLLNAKCFPDLLSIDQKIDIVNIFRKPELVLPVVEQAIEIGARVVWMQLGVVNDQAAELALKNGLKVVMDKCIKIEHMKYIR